jgi:hypothetical protein
MPGIFPPAQDLELIAPSSAEDAKLFGPDANHVARVELAASPKLGLTVDPHLTVGDQGLRLRASSRGAGKLEQLAEADHLAVDLD